MLAVGSPCATMVGDDFAFEPATGVRGGAEV
jgi:hypothetical protein